MVLGQVEEAVVLGLEQEQEGLVWGQEQAQGADCRFLVGNSLVFLLRCRPVRRTVRYSCLVDYTHRLQSYHWGTF